MAQKWREPFVFRGLRFRESAYSLSGIQVYDPVEKRWFDTAMLNRRSLEKDTEVPDIAKWGKRMAHLGTLRYIEELDEAQGP